MNSDDELPGFCRQAICFHATSSSRIHLSPLPELRWLYPNWCNAICDRCFRCWPSVESMGRTNGCMQSPLKQRVLIAFQLPSHSGSQSLLAGVTSPKDQGTKPGEQEGDRWQILGQRGHFWSGLFSHVANETTQCYIKSRVSDWLMEVEEAFPGNC